MCSLFLPRAWAATRRESARPGLSLVRQCRPPAASPAAYGVPPACFRPAADPSASRPYERRAEPIPTPGTWPDMGCSYT